MKTINVSPEKVIGEIRPMNCVGGGPITSNFEINAVQEFIDAGIELCRTHDIEYPLGSGEYVDIHCIFPDFKKDVNDPESYNFIFTDEYFKGVLQAKAKPFYRLGSTIEHQPVKRYIYPPEDYEKWGEICSHIIAHYNEGWANGFHMGIEYWEIWNEPDLKNRCWIGDDESYFRLYVTASKILKREHPDVKIGGCAVTSPKTRYADDFLAYVAKEKAPLDFFSWHGYIHTPEEAKELSEHASMLLSKYGFTEAESIYDEWNYVVRWDDTIQRSIDMHPTAFCAAFTGAVMSALQETKLDLSFYYDVQVAYKAPWNGVFSPGPMTVHGESRGVVKEKTYYALKAWGDLKALGKQVFTEAGKDLYVTASSDGKLLRVLISYYNDDAGFGNKAPRTERIRLNFGDVSFQKASLRITDRKHTDAEVSFDGRNFVMQGNSIAVLEYKLK